MTEKLYTMRQVKAAMNIMSAEYKASYKLSIEQMKKEYEKSVDDLTEDYKKCTAQMVTWAFVVGMLVGTFVGVSIAGVIQVMFGS